MHDQWIDDDGNELSISCSQEMHFDELKAKLTTYDQLISFLKERSQFCNIDKDGIGENIAK